ncbi:zinc-ribbon domain-containing protein [Photobacterium sp. ZSDE20]|uniref:Zinc-ribbon domain-containing protein n=1 Tax=Photobacterium pectinilyticum TaxID=2906793 RepID=A0ABT1N792_9GAMM|nr:zinc-ribbon domain-containing protein [Photobacterium sp. ZSDE20]MCQ1060615.1 zinc-ribbon domain-containing protein [Photobacterium sp. ZSDE20]MDD1827810.1 zinc-ribbon domain-containing protein [Photobacterium sp. ZSDE20]
MDTAKFIENSKRIFGDQFDYRDAEYKHAKEPVTLWCTFHDEEEKVLVKPDGHYTFIFGGCKNCYALRKNKDHHQYKLNILRKRVPTASNVKEELGDMLSFSCDKHGFQIQSLTEYDSFGCIYCSLQIKRKNITHVEYDPSKREVTYCCNIHGEHKASIEDYLTYSCLECKSEENKSRFFESLSPEIAELNDYSDTVFGHTVFNKLEINYRCIKHNIQCVQGVTRHLKGKSGCKKCHKEKMSLSLNEFHANLIPERKAYFIKKAHEIWGTGTFCYPNLDIELTSLDNKITMICNMHKHPVEIKTITAREHITVTNHNGKGAGCYECKKIEASKRLRKPFGVVVARYKLKGLTVLSEESEYCNSKSKLLMKCRNGHITRTEVAKILYTNQGCTECNPLIGETVTLKVLGEYFGVEFEKKRFKTNTGKHQYLELDGYNDELKIGIEYQGPSHLKRSFHRSHKSWMNQLDRDDATRNMCYEKGIKLIEVHCFKMDKLEADNIFDEISKGFARIGILFDQTKITSLDEILDGIINSESLLYQLDDISEGHNLTLLDERIYWGVEHRYNWRCKTCNFEFPSSISLRNKAKNKCCPKCSNLITRQRLKEEYKNADKSQYLENLRERVLKRGVKLSTEQWLGTEGIYEGTCIHCGLQVKPFPYNKTVKHKNPDPFCICQAKHPGMMKQNW